MQRGLGRVRIPIPNPLRKFPDPALRLIIAAALLGSAIFGVTSLIPAYLTDTNLQVARALERETSRDIKYAGADVCTGCHPQVNELKQKGYHRNLSCETCHGPARTHAENFLEVKPPAPRHREFCPTCHAYNPSRPLGFPQINPVTHNPLEPCISCHQPHDPKPPTVPGECRACHNQIERTKALSPHALLDCTTCHATPDEHKVKPWAIHPSKPADRGFCGTCHSQDSPIPKPPKIDLATHGQKYVCWQCHYPHMPEVQL